MWQGVASRKVDKYLVIMMKKKEIGLLCLVMLIFASCRTAKHTVEHYEARDSVVSQKIENRSTTIEWLKADTLSVAIVIEQLDTAGRVTTRAVVTKQRKIDNYATKIDSISVSSEGKQISQKLVQKESKPVRASSSLIWISFALGLIILVIFLVSKWLRH